MKMISLGCAAVAAAATVAALSMPASASRLQGCNGVVNPFVWGCAPWDNNNGPKYPYYKKKQETLPLKDVKLVSRNGAQFAEYRGETRPVVAVQGGNVITIGGANAVAAGGAN